MFDILYLQMDKLGLSQRSLASKTNVSLSLVNKFLKDKRPIRFDYVLKIVKFLLPEKEKEIMLNYCLISENRNLRLALEYTSINREFKTMKMLLDKAMNDKNTSVREWGKIYDLVYKCQTAEVNYKSSLVDTSIIRRQNTNVKELKIILLILEIYSFYFKNDITRIYQLAKELETEVEEITESYIKSTYSTRIFELLAHAELKFNNNITKAIEYCNLILKENVSEWYNATAFFVKGLANYYDNFEQCIYNLTLCKEIYEKANRIEWVENIEVTIEQVYLFWGKEIHFKHKINNDVFLLLNNQIEPEKLLMQINENNKGFILYYMGKMTKDVTALYQSLVYYTKIGDLFRARMPRKELLELGENEVLINDILSLNKY